MAGPGAMASGMTGTYAGTLATADFTVPLTMDVTEEADGRVHGTAELRRGDVLIVYRVEGTHTGTALTLALDTEADDMAVRAVVADGGRRVSGTASGGDLTGAALVLTRGAPMAGGSPRP